MRIGVLTRADEPFSFRNYRENVLARLDGVVGVVPYGLTDRIPAGCDVLWDPGLGMARIPKVTLRAASAKCRVPLVCTVHGLRAFSVPATELAAGARKRLGLTVTKFRRQREWRRLAPGVAKIIGVSTFGASEIVSAFGLPPEKITSIHHGVDHDIYTTEGEARRCEQPYFLHVSSYQRKKNIERLLAVYGSLDTDGRPDLVLVCPGAPRAFGEHSGVTLIDTGLSAPELATWYRGALAFLFPSLHETFGMPIIEAMACGCPVLTSDTTACPEVTGTAALLVDPRDETALREGLTKLISDERLRNRLAESGPVHAARFDWQTCADRHFDVLCRVAERRL